MEVLLLKTQKGNTPERRKEKRKVTSFTATVKGPILNSTAKLDTHTHTHTHTHIHTMHERGMAFTS